MAAKPAAARTRTWGLRLTVFLSAVQAGRLTGKYEGRGLPRPSRQAVKSGLAAADLDVGSRAGLVVEDRARRGVDDAVRRRVGDRDLDVLDPGVVRALQLGQRGARVTAGVVGVERLHARHSSTNVGLRGGFVGPRAEAEVRGDRDRKQDPEDDDHDEQLDQGEALLLTSKTLPQILHSSLLRLVETAVARNRSAYDCRRLTPERGRPFGLAEAGLEAQRKRKGAVSRALFEPLRRALAVAHLDVGSRAGLVVEDRARRGVDDAVRRRVRDRDLDVLDPGVVRALQLGQRGARVTGGVVGVERLHARHGGADVGLRRGFVGPRAEAEVRGDRDRKQDPEDDDDDQELDEGETLVAPQSLLKPCMHAVFLLEGVRRWPDGSIDGHPGPDAPPEKVNRNAMQVAVRATLKSVTGAADSEPSGNGGHLVFGRRSARADGGAERVGSARDRWRAPSCARARQARAPAGNPAADPRRHAAAALPDPLHRAAEAPGARAPDRPRALDSGPRALPRERLLAARVARGSLPPDPDGDQDARGARHPVGAPRPDRSPARARARHRPDRLRKVDHPRGPDRRDQPQARRAHPHDRGPDRVRAPAQALRRQPARDRRRRDQLRARAARRAPPGPGRDPPRRDARPRDDLDRADRGRDRPPRLRHPAHPERARDDRPRDRRIPGGPAGPDPHPACRHARGRRHPGAAPDRRRQWPCGRPRDSLSRRRRAEPDSPGEGRAGVLGHADRHREGHADDGAVPRRPDPARRDRARRGAVPLQPAGAAARLARARGLHRFRRRRRRGPPAPAGGGGMTMEWSDDVQPDEPVEETQELRHAPEPAEVAPEAVEAEPVAVEPEPEPEAEKSSMLKKEIPLPFGRKPKQPKAAKAPKAPKEPKAPKAKREKPAKAQGSGLKKEISLPFGRKKATKEPLAEEPKEKTARKAREKGQKRSSTKRAKRLVGLKIGGSQLAAARIVNNGHPELVQVARDPLDLGIVVGGELREPELLAEALRTFFRKHKLPRQGVRLGIANNRIGVRIFEIAGISDAKQLENAIRFRAQEALPIPIEEAVLDYHVLGERTDEDGQLVRRILLVVAYRELIDRYVAACKKAGLRLAGIDLEAFALVRPRGEALGPDSPRSDAALVVVSVGHDRSTFAVSDGQVCEFTRVLDWGGSTLDVALARELDCAPSEAEPIKRQLSLGAANVPDGLTQDQADRAREAVRRQLQTFARELVSSLQFYQNQPGSLGIGEIVITGGTAHLSGVADELQRLIGVRVEVGDPLLRVKLGKKLREADEQLGSLAVAIGLGIED